MTDKLDEKMQWVVRRAMREATETCARIADRIGPTLPENVTGRQALAAFAAAIRAQNNKLWPVKS